jgi:hypothetical protein
MSSEKEILGLEDKRFGERKARSLKLIFLNAWTRTPQGWKFVAWQSCPQPA